MGRDDGDFVRWPQVQGKGAKHNPRIGAEVLPEIHAAFEAERIRLYAKMPWVRRQEGACKGVNRTDMVNWGWAGLMALPPEVRDRLWEYGREACEERQRSPDPIPIPPEGLPGARLGSVVGEGGELPRVGRRGLPGYGRPGKRRDRGKGLDSASNGTDHTPRR